MMLQLLDVERLVAPPARSSAPPWVRVSAPADFERRQICADRDLRGAEARGQRIDRDAAFGAQQFADAPPALLDQQAAARSRSASDRNRFEQQEARRRRAAADCPARRLPRDPAVEIVAHAVARRHLRPRKGHRALPTRARRRRSRAARPSRPRASRACRSRCRTVRRDRCPRGSCRSL